VPSFKYADKYSFLFCDPKGSDLETYSRTIRELFLTLDKIHCIFKLHEVFSCSTREVVPVLKNKSISTQSPNPFAAKGYKLSSLTHKCCCVAVKMCSDGSVKLRDTKNPGGPALTFNKDEWSAFIGGVKLGEFEV